MGGHRAGAKLQADAVEADVHVVGVGSLDKDDPNGRSHVGAKVERPEGPIAQERIAGLSGESYLQQHVIGGANLHAVVLVIAKIAGVVEDAVCPGEGGRHRAGGNGEILNEFVVARADGDAFGKVHSRIWGRGTRWTWWHIGTGRNSPATPSGNALLPAVETAGFKSAVDGQLPLPAIPNEAGVAGSHPSRQIRGRAQHRCWWCFIIPDLHARAATGKTERSGSDGNRLEALRQIVVNDSQIKVGRGLSRRDGDGRGNGDSGRI